MPYKIKKVKNRYVVFEVPTGGGRWRLRRNFATKKEADDYTKTPGW